MTKVLKSDGSMGDAFAAVDLGSAISEIWLTFRIALDADSLIAWSGVGSSNLVQLLAADDTSGAGTLGVDPSSEWELEGDTGNEPAGGRWYDAEIHRVTSGLDRLYLAGALDIDGTEVTDNDAQFVQLGQSFVIANGGIVYFSSIKIGTTRGADDLFSWPDTSTDLSAFTTTSGDVSVVDDPFAPPVLNVQTGVSPVSDSFTTVASLPLTASSARRRWPGRVDTQQLSWKLVQVGASASTQILSVEVETRGYPEQAEVG